MPINIHTSYSNPLLPETNKFHNAYKKNVDENLVNKKNVANDVNNTKQVVSLSNNFRDYLSTDEVKVLKEVFGDINNGMVSSTPYNNKSNPEFVKGGIVDIRL